MNVQVIERDSMNVVGISWNGTYSERSTIPTLFSEMEKRLEEIPNKTGEPVLIAPFHSRETEFTYYVTAPVEKIDNVPKGMIGFTIPKKNYVFATHDGSPKEVEDTYREIFTWMKEYGYEQDHHALSLEIYKEEDKDQNVNGDLHFEIYLPVRTYRD